MMSLERVFVLWRLTMSNLSVPFTSTSNTDTRNLVGKKATVSTYIPQGRMGQIVTQDEHGGTVYLNARTEADHDIDQGAQVVITEASGGMVIVARPTR
jgi:membrane-bound ClpP family serine protease